LGLLVGTGVEELGAGAVEVFGGGVGWDAAGEDLLVGDIGAVVGLGVFLVLVDDVAGEVDSGEDAFGAGVGEEGGVGELGGGGLGVASDGAGGDGGVRA